MPTALVVSPADAWLPECPGQAVAAASRHIRRHRLLAALAHRVLGAGGVPPLLVAGADGVRRLAGTAWFASVTERAGWVAAAIAPHPVGIDVESIAEAAAARAAVLDGVAAIDLAAWPGFAGIWAAREAVLKAMGRDLSRDPGGWRFADGVVTASGCPPHVIERVALPGFVATLAYVGD